MALASPLPSELTIPGEAVCYINGKRHVLPPGRAETTLLQYLREINLKGTKLGCGEGGCGACTVMLSHCEDGKIVHRAVNACLCPLYAVDNMHVVTVEGLGNPRDGLHPVQEVLSKSHGSQCGFCTPGFVMSMYSLLRSSQQAPSEEEVEDALGGNLCRCTGYRPILDAFKTFTKADPGAYTEEAIAAAKGIAMGGGAATGKGSAAANGQKVCPSTGMPCDCGASGAEASAPAKAGCCGGGAGGSAAAEQPAAAVCGCGEGAACKGACAGGCGGGCGGGCNCAKTAAAAASCACGADSACKGACGAACGGGCGAGCNCPKTAAKEAAAACACSADSACKGACAGKCGGSCDGGCNCASPAAPPARPTAEPIFPAELKRRPLAPLYLPGPKTSWYRPVTLAQLLALKAAHPAARLVCGNTEVGIEMKFKAAGYKVMVAPQAVPELNEIVVTDAGVEVGAAVTLTRLRDAFQELIGSRPAHQTAMLRAIVNQLRWFAGCQIRNVSSLAGNICTGSPISDLNPLWMAGGAVFTAMGQDTGSRQVKASEFFLGYRKIALEPHEVLYRVFLPWTRPGEFVREFKQSPRREDDIAIVNAGMRVLIDVNDGTVMEADFAYGGVAAKTIMTKRVAGALIGKPWTRESLEAALALLQADIALSDTAPGGRIEYRRSLAASFLFKFFAHVACGLQQLGCSLVESVPAELQCAAQEYHRPGARGVQFHAKVPADSIVGQPHRHMAADLQVCGEAVYVDDIKLPADALHAVLVASSRPHARLVRVDPSEALKVPGVEGFYDHRSVPGDNTIGPVFHDEVLFAVGEVTAVGQAIGVVVAASEAAAREAARKVQVEYEDLPSIISIAEAVAAQSFQYQNEKACGDVEAAFASAECEVVVSGTLNIGGQEHFYLEPNGSVVIPVENDEYLTYCSTQDPSKHQKFISCVLGVPMHKVVSKAKRLGGGFGGKETRAIPFNCMAAVAAYHSRRAVRLVLDRDEDMLMTGQRHAFQCIYKAGATRGGKLVALDLQFYSNGGNSQDLSFSVMDRCLLHCGGCYACPNIRARGAVCKTHQASHTAFRGFGGPQGIMASEMIMEHLARELGMAPEALRELNMQQEGDVLHYGQVLRECRLQSCWSEVMASSGFAARKAAVAQFNAGSRWRKRGLYAMPTKFGISFTAVHLNQAGALVHVYTDGTVLVTHGGVEMGQGLHTKVAMVAAQEFGIPLGQVFIAETSSDKVANASPTAASAGSDLYGASTLDACRQITARLQPFREAMPGAPFKDVVLKAYMERVDLSAHGFYSTPDITGAGGAMPFNYFSYGTAVAEVELDCLTGDWQLLRADVVFDVGNPINPAIDIGQIEGGFVQGMGWLCLEELVWGDEEHQWVGRGQLFTKGPGTYKIPSVNDIPLDFRVSLLQGAPNPRAVHSSKAIGEPPLALGGAVMMALKEAVYAAREEAGVRGWFRLDAPATPERLRMACADHITAAHAAPAGRA